MHGISYYSTNGVEGEKAFLEAARMGLAGDGGLFFPSSIPQLTSTEIESLKDLNYAQTAALVLSKFIPEIPEAQIYELAKASYNFEPKIDMVRDHMGIMRLDQGPTASFKDFAAVLMARFIQLSRKEGEDLCILTATSGDTGSAVANAFKNLDGIQVIILFPEDEVSENQRRQMTTTGAGNIHAIAIDGKFDDAQALVKQAFQDPDLKHLNLTSANSINIARLLPQVVYYWWAWAHSEAGEEHKEIIFSVPSGNFGNMMGAVLASKMGLPLHRLIVGTNANDAFVRFLENCTYEKISPSKNCISNAMNVGHPSNLARLIHLYGGRMDQFGNLFVMPDMETMKKDIWAMSVSDEKTKQTIKRAYTRDHVVLEPHGAVAWYALSKYFEEEHSERLHTALALETAHQGKFPEYIHELLGFDPQIPDSIRRLARLQEQFLRKDASYASFKKLLSGDFFLNTRMRREMSEPLGTVSE
jgi:threonine synthase